MGEVKNVYPNLNDQSFILNKINETKDYLIANIRDRELMSKMSKVNILLPLTILINL